MLSSEEESSASATRVIERAVVGGVPRKHMLHEKANKPVKRQRGGPGVATEDIKPQVLARSGAADVLLRQRNNLEALAVAFTQFLGAESSPTTPLGGKDPPATFPWTNSIRCLLQGSPSYERI